LRINRLAKHQIAPEALRHLAKIKTQLHNQILFCDPRDRTSNAFVTRIKRTSPFSRRKTAGQRYKHTEVRGNHWYFSGKFSQGHRSQFGTGNRDNAQIAENLKIQVL
jgi:hypothetical protein